MKVVYIHTSAIALEWLDRILC